MAGDTVTTEKAPLPWYAPFLKRLAQSPNVSAACRAAKISRQQAYRRREEDPTLAALWQEAVDTGVDSLVEVGWRRAKKESDTLLIFLLKAHRPDVYRETINQRLGGPNGESLSFLGLVQAAQSEPERP